MDISIVEDVVHTVKEEAEPLDARGNAPSVERPANQLQQPLDENAFKRQRVGSSVQQGIDAGAQLQPITVATTRAHTTKRSQTECLDSTMVPSEELRQIALSLGNDASCSPAMLGIPRFYPPSTTVALTLTPTQLEMAQNNNVVAHGGAYYLGFCQLRSEKYLVRPLLTQLLEKVVAFDDYYVFDVHDKDTQLFDGKRPSNLVCRAAPHSKQLSLIAGLEEVDIATIPSSAQLGITDSEEKEPIEGPADDVQVVDVAQLGITPERIGIIVEAKAYRKIEEPAAHEHILTNMRAFLSKHVGRRHVFGVLTDLHSAYVYQMFREPIQRNRCDYELHEIACIGKFTGTEVLQVLRQLPGGDGDLLDDSPFLLRDQSDNTYTYTEVKCISKLGRGGFGRVLHIQLGTDDYALKIPTDDWSGQAKHILEAELAMTLQVAGKNSHVPSLIRQVSSMKYRGSTLLLMKPVGKPHSSRYWTKSLLLDLIRGLCELWKRETPILIVHRDIRSANIVYVNDSDGERLVLIDWGCAVPHMKKGFYAGSRAYAAYRLYSRGWTDRRELYSAELTDDCGSLLLTAAAVFLMPKGRAEACETFGVGGNDVMQMRCFDWRQFWEARLPPRWWSVYTNLAGQPHEDAYASLMQFLDEHLPQRPTWT